MASSDYKLHKTELVALYKLEFYRKQKSWKFAYDGKKTPRSKYTKTRKTLNETYDIENVVKNETSPLNKGFVEEVPDKDMETPKQTLELGNMLSEEPGYSQPWSEHYSEPERDDGMQKWWDTEQELCNDPAWEDPPLPEYGSWAGDGVPLSNHLEAPQAWFTGAAVQTPLTTHQQIEELASAIERCATLADISGQLDQLDGAIDGQHDASSDSLAEFIRGAHLAPHSSEIDLRDDTQSVHSASVASRASRLSASALSTRVRLHASALAALLRETALRRTHHLSRACSELLPGPCEGEGWGAGRGRGRLHRHVVGVDMGRPYRL